MLRALKAFPTMTKVGIAEAVAYRAEFLIWILSTNMPLIMLALWHAVAREQPIGGFGPSQVTAYFLVTLIVRLLTGSWVVWEMNMELRQGTLALRMLRPVHPMAQYCAENLGAMPLRLVVTLPIAVIALVVAGADQLTHDPVNVAVFVVATFGAWAINFLAMGVIACLAFWLESSLSIFQVWLGAYMLLSGYMVPLDLFPPWIKGVALVLPFRFMIAFPVETLTGRYARAEALTLLGWQLATIAGLFVVLQLAWRAGVRRYSAYGG